MAAGIRSGSEASPRGLPMKIASALLAVSLLTAGCASGAIKVSETGARPDLAGASGLQITAGAHAPSSAVSPMIAQLDRAGLGARGGGQGYLLEISYSERPLPVGAYAGAAPAQDEANWVAAPGQARWWTSQRTQLCTLAVRVVDAAAGAEAYSVRATTQGRGADCGRAPDELAGAVAAKLAAKPAG